MADMYLIFGSLILLGISKPVRQPKWLSPASWSFSTLLMALKPPNEVSP